MKLCVCLCVCVCVMCVYVCGCTCVCVITAIIIIYHINNDVCVCVCSVAERGLYSVRVEGDMLSEANIRKMLAIIGARNSNDKQLNKAKKCVYICVCVCVCMCVCVWCVCVCVTVCSVPNYQSILRAMTITYQ